MSHGETFGLRGGSERRLPRERGVPHGETFDLRGGSEARFAARESRRGILSTVLRTVLRTATLRTATVMAGSRRFDPAFLRLWF